ncbi:MAG: saccharopine dehydrogenase NADP-binding domain-containing protein [Thermoplasmata archaeon]
MSLRIAILGIGGYGRAAAMELASDRRVSELLLIDRRGDRARVLQHALRPSTSALELDVTDAQALRHALSEVDVAVNMIPSQHNIAIMRACLDAGCGYVDVSSHYPTSPNERGDILEQLDQGQDWRDRGLTAIVSMGSDPGLSNVMARVASDRLQRIDAIRIRRSATGPKAVDGFPMYSREIFLEDALSRPVIWEAGELVDQEPASGEETFEFPSPIGARRVHLFRHEEVLTLPLRLGKPVGRVDYKHDINPDLIRAIHALNALGLFTSSRYIRIGAQRVLFRDSFLATFPEPSTLLTLQSGALAIVVELTGRTGQGEEIKVRGWVVMENREASRRHATTPEHVLAADAAAAGAILIGTKKAPRAGVLAPEELPPEIVMPELEARGVQLDFAPPLSELAI